MKSEAEVTNQTSSVSELPQDMMQPSTVIIKSSPKHSGRVRENISPKAFKDKSIYLTSSQYKERMSQNRSSLRVEGVAPEEHQISDAKYNSDLFAMLE